MRASIDPYEGLPATADAIDLKRLRRSLALPRRTLDRALILTAGAGNFSEVLRYCPTCMARGSTP